MAFGIDYSMTCPAACDYLPGEDNKAFTRFWYAHATKAHLSLEGVDSVDILDTPSVTKRAAFLAVHLRQWIERQSLGKCKRVFIEDYAFAATGRVFHIGENAGILKHFLDEAQIEYVAVPPTVIKKFATGKGNADKTAMTAAFLEAHPDARSWIPRFFPRLKADGDYAKSPLADLADAYWLARYAAEKA